MQAWLKGLVSKEDVVHPFAVASVLGDCIHKLTNLLSSKDPRSEISLSTEALVLLLDGVVQGMCIVQLPRYCLTRL